LSSLTVPVDPSVPAFVEPTGPIPPAPSLVSEVPIVEPVAPVEPVDPPEEEPIVVVEPELPPPVDPIADPSGLRAEAKLHHLDSLKNVSVPIPSNIGDFVKDQAAAVALGKALFWDQQAGSDRMACASCHFHAGGDNRIKNQVSPGILGGNGKFHFFASSASSGGPNYTLKRNDFPFHQKKDVTNDDLGDNVRFDTDDVASSGGVLDVAFLGLGTKLLPRSVRPCVTQDVHIIRRLVDSGILPSSELNEILKVIPLPFNPSVNGLRSTFVTEILTVRETDPLGFFITSGGKKLNLRRVEPRNTPTTINAVFNYRNFWDGRANFNFNGRNPFGPRDKDAKVFQYDGSSLTEVPISLDFASLASQAVGPAESVMEMSAHDRNFLHIARKLLNSQPLRNQFISYTDSVLGSLSRSTSRQNLQGLKVSYPALIQKAFVDKWWNAPGEPVTVQSVNYTHMEANFSMFWGIAIMMYERTLVSDQTRF